MQPVGTADPKLDSFWLNPEATPERRRQHLAWINFDEPAHAFFQFFPARQNPALVRDRSANLAGS